MSCAQILVVEDESIVAKDLQNRLSSLGYSVPAVASSGEEAIHKAMETKPDLILMDIMLPGEMDGIEASRRIADRLDVPIIYLTAYSDDDTVRRAKDSSPFGYLLKPYGEKELHTTIEMTLARHRLESRVRESERWLAATLRCVGDAVIATDARGSIKLVNSVAESLTGWSRYDAADKYLSEVVEIKTQDNGFNLEGLAAVSLRRGIATDLPKNALLITRNRRQTPVEGSATPILDDEGIFSGFVLAFRDVSQRLRAEEGLQRSEQALRQAHKMEAIGRMAGGVAHDFNNLLTIVLGNLSLACSSFAVGDPNRNLVEFAETASWRAAELVKRLLGFSQQARLMLKPLSVNSLLRETVKLLQRIVDPRITLHCDLDPNIWPVYADGAQLNDVFLNICLNARDAMPHGGRLSVQTRNITIDEDYVRSHVDAAPGEFVRLHFNDTGHGIPLEIQDRIFEPFFTTKEPGKGTGLGLAMVFGIVRQHRGWIECRSEVNEGTSFELYLPRCTKEIAKPTNSSGPAAPRGTGETILLVDDDAMVRDFAERVLRGHGYRVMIAEDGKQAVEVFRRQQDQIDLVILDLTMPRLSGQDALHQLVQIKPGVRVILISGYFTEGALPAGNDRVLGVVGKPYRIEELLTIVRSALDAK
jgi:two-component system, cell cycle sensor histidine kinase and response regulator CckA